MDNFRGALLMMLSMLGFALEDMFIKLLADAAPVGQIILMLGIGGSVVFGAVVLLRGEPLWQREMACWPIFWRAVAEMVGVIAFILAFVLTSLSSASALLQATPLAVTFGAAVFLGEKVGWRRWSAIFVGLLGVLLIIRPGLDSFEVLSLLSVLAVLMLATRDITTRLSPNSLSSMQLSFLGFAALPPAGLALMWWQATPLVAISGLPLVYFLAAMTVGIFAYYAIVAAMRLGEVSFVTPFRYTRLLFALIFGVLIFGERPDALTLLGAAVIVASGIYTVWRERKAALAA